METKICPVCKKTHKNKKFCSFICRGLFIEKEKENKKGTWKECPVCKTKHNNKKFCSNKCNLEWISVHGKNIKIKTYKDCATCGEPFIFTTRRVKFCSQECKKRIFKFKSDVFCDVTCIRANTEKKTHPNTYLSLTPEKAYLLGLLFRYGRVSDMNLIRLYADKKEPLEEIKKILEADYPISKVDWKTIDRWHMKLRSMTFVWHLIEFGMGTYPTLTEFPIIKKEHWSHFIKGYLKYSKRMTLENGKTYFHINSHRLAQQLIDVGFNVIWFEGQLWIG